MFEPEPHRRIDGGAPLRWLVLTGAVTGVMLVFLITYQPFDTNFYSLWEATNLLAGDHPYRDFFEWGVPLQAMLSAAMQWIVGYRMGGEFVLIHWPFIIAGAVISFDLGYRLTRSVTATAFTALLALAVLPDTPTFHYPKLFLYPAAIWLAWRYMERPGVRAAAALGLLTAAGFLFRHDHGIYIGIAAVLACVLVRAADIHRPWRRYSCGHRRVHRRGCAAVAAMAGHGADERGAHQLCAHPRQPLRPVGRRARLQRHPATEPVGIHQGLDAAATEGWRHRVPMGRCGHGRRPARARATIRIAPSGGPGQRPDVALRGGQRLRRQAERPADPGREHRRAGLGPARRSSSRGFRHSSRRASGWRRSRSSSRSCCWRRPQGRWR